MNDIMGAPINPQTAGSFEDTLNQSGGSLYGMTSTDTKPTLDNEEKLNDTTFFSLKEGTEWMPAGIDITTLVKGAWRNISITEGGLGSENWMQKNWGTLMDLNGAFGEFNTDLAFLQGTADLVVKGNMKLARGYLRTVKSWIPRDASGKMIINANSNLFEHLNKAAKFKGKALCRGAEVKDAFAKVDKVMKAPGVEKSLGVLGILGDIDSVDKTSKAAGDTYALIKQYEGELERLKRIKPFYEEDKNCMHYNSILYNLREAIKACEAVIKKLKWKLARQGADCAVQCYSFGADMWSLGVKDVSPNAVLMAGYGKCYEKADAYFQKNLDDAIRYYRSINLKWETLAYEDDTCRRPPRRPGDPDDLSNKYPVRYNTNSHSKVMGDNEDPSGNVYEAVLSNPISGITATIYKADDSIGTNAAPWNAAEYDQISPQITTDEGAYEWYVPEGWWQVRFTDESGKYANAQTDWMEVLPPRIGLVTYLTDNTAPEVSSVKAYPDYIEVLYSQYMNTSVLPTVEGVSGTVAWVDPEQGVNDGHYSKVLQITPEEHFEKNTEITFELSAAQSYNGQFTGPVSGTFTVEVRPAQLVLLRYEADEDVSVNVGKRTTVGVKLLDSEGNPMPGVTLSSSLFLETYAVSAAEAVTGPEGVTAFAIDGTLPGYTNITFSVENSSLTKTSGLMVQVNDENAVTRKPLRPTATVGSYRFTASSPKENKATVSGGSKLTISAEEGVTIYYTTDDTCPCDPDNDRYIYTEPFEVANGTKYRIAAYDGATYSDRLNISVTVRASGGPTETPDQPEEPKTCDGGEGCISHPFTDVDTKQWYHEAVDYAIEHGLMRGVGGGRFAPQGTLSRAMLCQILYNKENRPETAAESKFTDVKAGAWYEKAVTWAAENKLVTGYGKGKFGPDDPITREQLAVILCRYAEFKGESTALPEDTSLLSFSDIEKVDHWAMHAILWAADREIMTGKGNALDPLGSAKRCEAAAMLMRYLEQGK